MRKIFKKLIPLKLLDYYSKIKYSSSKSKFFRKSTEETFSQIFNEKIWGNGESISGPGSSIKQAENAIKGMNALIKKYKIKTILDLPCGDFNWMRFVDLSEINYMGGDIVNDLIVENTKKYEATTIHFKKINIIKDELPLSDLIISRDCFVHFSYSDFFASIENIKKTNCKYILSTTFQKHTLNYDIITGDWRPINLQRPPFNFPRPILIITEFHEKKFEREFKGKSLALWKISDLP